jgi:hypothetical protein
VCALSVEQRGRGEADGWATTTVPGGGAADERGPSAAGEGEMSRALTGRTGLSAGVDVGEATASVGRAWAGPGRKRVGRAQMSSTVLDLFKLIQTSSN